jgi:carnosine N-methyltransferase
MGRFSRDFERLFRRVWAVDSSVMMALAYRLLSEGPLVYYYLNMMNAETVQEQVRRSTMSIQASETDVTKGRGEFTYLVADANALPFAPNSVWVVLSIFFSDVIPLRGLLQEAHRVLPAGGIFAHFGPLHYHFDDARDMLPVEEVRKAVGEAGFDIIYEQRVPTVQQRKPASMSYHTFRNWCFAARKRSFCGLP